jgi:hypothetical protein
VTAWGRNYEGQTNVPPGIGSVASIAAGWYCSLALRGPALAEIPAASNLVVASGCAVDIRRGILGFKPQTFQWLRNNTNLVGATNYVLRFASARPSDSGTYRVVVTNSFAALTSSPVVLQVFDLPPTIVTQSLTQTIMPGFPADLSVTVSGASPMAYQWYFNNSTRIEAATNSNLHLTNFQTAQAGTYSVVITNLFGSVTSLPIVLSLSPSNTVPGLSEGYLRAAIASGVRPVNFNCDGTIILGDTISINSDTVIDGTGHQITISGSNTVRVFYVSTNSTLTLSNLTLAAGYSTNAGAAIYCDGGNVKAQTCIFSNNWAVGTTGNVGGFAVPSQGGAILSIGNLALHNCVFIYNQAIGASVSGGNGQGGAVFNLGASAFDYCKFWQNAARGGDGYVGAGGGAAGGAVYNSGTLALSNCTFAGNDVVGGNAGAGQPGFPAGVGGIGGEATGGAVFNSGLLQIQSSLVTSNITVGGQGGVGGGGSILGFWPYGSLGTDGGRGGIGGAGSGAIFNSGTAILINDTVAFNQSFGGTGGTGGTGGGPTILTNYYGPLGNSSGGGGGGGGSAFGNIYDISGNLMITNCTVAFNLGAGGSGGTGGSAGSGNGRPGSPGTSGTNGVALGGITMLSGVFANTLLASNTPVNCSGAVAGGICNLSSDASVAFTGTGSRTNINPMIGPLANNGGPTLTMALLPGSPAIDAGAAAGAPATDQRGVARPQGPGVDIGAFEFQYIPFFPGVAIRNATNCQLQMAGLLPNQSFTVQASSNLVNWFTVTNLVFGTNGVFQFVDPVPTNCRTRFYRFSTP